MSHKPREKRLVRKGNIKTFSTILYRVKKDEGIPLTQVDSRGVKVSTPARVNDDEISEMESEDGDMLSVDISGDF